MVTDEWVLYRIAIAVRYSSEDHETIQDKAKDGGHGDILSHIPWERPMLSAVERE